MTERDGRLRSLRRAELDADGQQLWDSLTEGRGARLVDADGGLIGPFNAFVHAPAVGQRLSSLGAVLRSGTSIERRLSEIAIITVGAHWQAEFEWWSHAAMARRHGVPDAAVDAIGDGREPEFDRADDRAVYAAAVQLSRTGRLDRTAYNAAHQFLGDTGMVELVALCGFYALISFLLNSFEVPLPPGETRMWGEPERRPEIPT